MRRVQQRYRRSGEFIRLPVEATSLIERRIRLGDDHQIADDVDSAVRLLVQTHSVDPAGMPTVIGARVSDDEVEILLARSAGSDGEFMVLREQLQGDCRDLTTAAPAPLLVSAGRNDDNLLVMANLEPLGSLAIDGDSRAGEDFVRALSLELATSYWAGQFDTVLVGFGSEFERFPRTMSLPYTDQIVDDLEDRARRGRNMLQRAGLNSYAEARCWGSRGQWEPLVVICGPAVARRAILDIVEIAADPACGAVVVAVGPVATALHTLRITADRIRTSMRLLGSVVEPQLIDSAELKEVGALIDMASNRQSVARAIAPYDLLTIRLPEPEPEPSRTPIRTQVPARRERVTSNRRRWFCRHRCRQTGLGLDHPYRHSLRPLSRQDEAVNLKSVMPSRWRWLFSDRSRSGARSAHSLERGPRSSSFIWRCIRKASPMKPGRQHYGQTDSWRLPASIRRHRWPVELSDRIGRERIIFPGRTVGSVLHRRSAPTGTAS